MITGPGFYFGGMLVALREARWFGSRLFPLLLPAAGLLLVQLAVGFGPSLPSTALVCFILVVDATMGVAAWGSFVNSGETTGQPRAALFALGASLWTATLLLSTTTFVAAALAIEGLRGTYDDPSRMVWSTHQVDRHGKVWLVQFEWVSGSYRASAVLTIWRTRYHSLSSVLVRLNVLFHEFQLVLIRSEEELGVIAGLRHCTAVRIEEAGRSRQPLQ